MKIRSYTIQPVLHLDERSASVKHTTINAFNTIRRLCRCDKIDVSKEDKILWHRWQQHEAVKRPFRVEPRSMKKWRTQQLRSWKRARGFYPQTNFAKVEELPRIIRKLNISLISLANVWSVRTDRNGFDAIVYAYALYARTKGQNQTVWRFLTQFSVVIGEKFGFVVIMDSATFHRNCAVRLS